MKQLDIISWDSDELTDADLLKVEKALGPLPEDYRQFLRDSNGGRLRGGDLEIEIHPPTGSLSVSKVHISQIEIVEPEFPPLVIPAFFNAKRVMLLPIAGAYQSPVLMRINGLGSGEVYYWQYSPERLWEAEDNSTVYGPNEKNTVRIAASFSEFLDLLPDVSESDNAPVMNQLEPSVENYARYGDQSISAATEFLDRYTVEELEAKWPKHGKHRFTPLRMACTRSQIEVVKYLIKRGVNFQEGITAGGRNFQTAKLLVESGASIEEQLKLLLVACGTIDSTTKPQEPVKIVRWLVDKGIQPDFSDEKVLLSWKKALHQIYSKTTLRFIKQQVQLPSELSEFIDRRLNRPSTPSSGVAWFNGSDIVSN